MEVICNEDRYQVYINRVLVNEGTKAHPSAGFIGVQNEWAECFFPTLRTVAHRCS